FMLISDVPIETDKMFQLTMLLPEEIDGEKEIVFTAESKWCKNDINADFFDTGFQIAGISPRAFNAIKLLIEDFMFINPKGNSEALH
ncbi:MAG: hypothetical protein V1753_05685, partial [Pseudomonadota bacterium]